jgi:peptidoglycan/LPS O-acetylase OafA/YrhL
MSVSLNQSDNTVLPGIPTVESTERASSWPRLDGVDILRGLAIFFVLMNHVNMRLVLAKIAYAPGLPSQLVSFLVWNAQHGVQVFFAVSGFLITSTSIRRWGSLSRVGLRDFYKLRFARIAPLLFLVILILCGLHAANVQAFVVSDKTGGLGRAVIAALTFHVNVLEAHRGYLPANWDVLWSLAVEEMFYLFFPLVCWLLGRGKGLVALLIVFVVLGPFGRTALAHGNEIWQEYSYLGGMDAIALGCLTAIASSRLTVGRGVVRIVAALGAALIILILAFSESTEAWGLRQSGLDMTILAIGSCMVIAAAAQTRWQSPRLLLPLVSLGRCSYEVYLTHMFVVFALYALFKSVAPMFGAVAMLFVCVILASGLLGGLVSRFYSEPMNRLIRQRLGDGPERLGSVVIER